MSGIAGILQRNGAPVNAQQLRSMAVFLSFRGPHAQRIWTSNSVGFAHAALPSTPESLLCPQPLTLDQRWFLTADARLDGMEDLRRRLIAQGESVPPGAADALLILHAYRAWGRDCLRHLRGDFSFALWDSVRRRLFCARDHVGIKPFFYAHTQNSFLFSNTLDCLRLHGEVVDDLDDSAIADFLLFGFLQQPEDTAFAAIRRLPPAHWMEVGDNAFEVRRYWRPPHQQTRRGVSAREEREQFAVLLQESVRDRLRCGKVAVLMSGGLDSTSVAAIAGRAGGCEVHAHTVGYDRQLPDDEPRWARSAAEALGIPWHFHAADSYRLFEDYRACAPPEPSLESLGIILQDELAAVSQYSCVQLSGDGGDLILFPPTLGGGLRASQLPAAVRYWLRYKRAPKIGLRTALRNALSPRSGARSIPAFLNPDLEKRFELQGRLQQPRKQIVVHPTRPLMYRSLASPYWPFALESYDAGVTRRAVENRHPFFSLALIEFVLTGPIHLENYTDKGMLRELMRGVLPEKVRLRPKTPFAKEPLLPKLRARQWCEEPPSCPVELGRYCRADVPTSLEQLAASPEDVPALLPAVALAYWLRRKNWMKEECARLDDRAAAVASI